MLNIAGSHMQWSSLRWQCFHPSIWKITGRQPVVPICFFFGRRQLAFASGHHFEAYSRTRRGIEPPPAVCQRHKSAAIPTGPQGHLACGAHMLHSETTFYGPVCGMQENLGIRKFALPPVGQKKRCAWQHHLPANPHGRGKHVFVGIGIIIFQISF